MNLEILAPRERSGQGRTCYMIPLGETSGKRRLSYSNREHGGGRAGRAATKGHRETSGVESDGYAHSLGCAGGFMSASMCQNSPKCTLEHVPCLLYLNKEPSAASQPPRRSGPPCHLCHRPSSAAQPRDPGRQRAGGWAAAPHAPLWALPCAQKCCVMLCHVAPGH